MVAFTRKQRAKYIGVHASERKIRQAMIQVRLLEEHSNFIQKKLACSSQQPQHQVFIDLNWMKLQLVERMKLLYMQYAARQSKVKQQIMDLMKDDGDEFAVIVGELAM